MLPDSHESFENLTHLKYGNLTEQLLRKQDKVGKKQFEDLAEEILRHNAVWQGSIEEFSVAQCVTLAAFCESQNKAFDYDSFMKACGF